MYGIVIFVLLLSLRSFSATVSVVLLILMSILSALGIAGWLEWNLTPTSAIAPLIFILLQQQIDYVVGHTRGFFDVLLYAFTVIISRFTFKKGTHAFLMLPAFINP